MKILFKKILVLAIILLVSCKREDRNEQHELPQKPKSEKLTNPVVNVYIENSGSMFGYINGNTEFKTDVRELLILLKFYYGDKNVNLAFINSDIYPIKTDNKMNFITDLTPGIFKVGNTNKSDMNDIFNQILNKTKKNTISILVSDCIYSVNGNANGLSVQKTGTKDAFLSKSKGKRGFAVSTAVVKLNSKFNGVYYDMNNGKHKTQNKIRPYYIVLMGSNVALNDIISKVDFSCEKMKGYQNKVILSSNNYSKQIYYTLVNTKNDKGRYRISREASTKDADKGMENIEMNNRSNGNFTFSTTVDLSLVPVEADYSLNKNNYKITEGNYKIKSIQKFNPKLLLPTSLPLLEKNNKKPTHLITFEATTKNFTNLKCILENKIPDWVNLTSTENDTNLDSSKNKTFGLKYLIEGITEANQIINTNSKDFFEMNLTINNN